VIYYYQQQLQNKVNIILLFLLQTNEQDMCWLILFCYIFVLIYTQKAFSSLKLSINWTYSFILLIYISEETLQYNSGHIVY